MITIMSDEYINFIQKQPEVFEMWGVTSFKQSLLKAKMKKKLKFWKA
jgi:hypothetical protein